MNQCQISGCNSFAINIDPKKQLCDVCFYKVPLLALLSVVHRDAQHADTYGIGKSTRIACKIVAKLHYTKENQ